MKSAHVIPLSTDTNQHELIVVGYLVHCKRFAEINGDDRIETLTRVVKKILTITDNMHPCCAFKQ